MFSKNLFKHTPTKLQSFKTDLAPIGFYFDIFSTELFQIPIMAIPMRIDKLTNKEGTFFIIPDTVKLTQLFEELDYGIDFEAFFLTGIKNLINYAKNKYKQIILRTLQNETIITWFKKSLSFETNIPYLTNDFTFLISEFLKLYNNIIKEDLNPKHDLYRKKLIQYCETIINYFQKKLEENNIQILKNNSIVTEKIYSEKRGNYYPEIIPIDIKDLKKNKIKTMRYVPYLIYDDFIDTFSYNKQCLNNVSINPINLRIFKRNRIIIKGSSIKNFKNFKIEKLLKTLNVEDIHDN